ncbi:hypothetical protein TSUD_293560 [Trifolium subterraneum]|uniref:Uncharacterized protein n=1 Tax=Trifolium subterraneum TaxID=3900 RepID=A0A2Z6MG59_TRISU|nr:hypothetical protein TSUD_293560 [Trifolium subterraneum]
MDSNERSYLWLDSNEREIVGVREVIERGVCVIYIVGENEMRIMVVVVTGYGKGMVLNEGGERNGVERERERGEGGEGEREKGWVGEVSLH